MSELVSFARTIAAGPVSREMDSGDRQDRERNFCDSRWRSVVILCMVVIFAGCQRRSNDVAASKPDASAAVNEVALETANSTDLKSVNTKPEESPKRKRRRKLNYLKTLSEYKLFRVDIVNHEPAEGVIQFDLNSPLFADYALKLRFIRLPDGLSAPYNGEESFDFPVGTVIAKTFGHENDMTDASKGRRFMETRILLHEEKGWIGLPYVWNDEQTEATLSMTGANVDVQWVHSDGELRQGSHLVPNMNDCKRCHDANKPIGPKARNINRDFAYPHGSENQLAHWALAGILDGAPKPEDAPRLAVWDDPSSGTLDERARSWLEINCAHCHSSTGPARNSGLHLLVSETDRFKWGVYKRPVAAGRGTGGRLYNIVPGKPDESIMTYRLETTHPGEMMPEFGRSMVDKEGAALIRQWIAEMEDVGDTASLLSDDPPTL